MHWDVINFVLMALIVALSVHDQYKNHEKRQHRREHACNHHLRMSYRFQRTWMVIMIAMGLVGLGLLVGPLQTTRESYAVAGLICSTIFGWIAYVNSEHDAAELRRRAKGHYVQEDCRK